MSDGGDDKYNKPRGPKGWPALQAWVAAQSKKQPPPLPALLGGALLLSLLCVYLSGSVLQQHVLTWNVLSSPIKEPPDGLSLDPQQHAADEMLLRQIVDECSKRQDTVLFVDPSSRQLVVADSIDPTHCPILDIMLRGAERGVGTCTDVGLYAMYAGGRIIPMPKDIAAYDMRCGPRTARLFLESMYGEFVSKQKGVLHLQLLNSEHLWTQDASMHARMQIFLCKTRFCMTLMQQHIVHKRYWASVWFMSHTSSDPSVGLSGDVAAGLRASLSLGKPVQQGYAIHVKGKSGLKQTRYALDCWAAHPEWPTLVVVGRASQEEVSLAARAAPNIAFLPPLEGAPGDTGGGEQQQQQQQQQLVDAVRVRDLQGAASIHVCPSVREGFGHYLNEARAVGALVVTVDHPPMNELVTPASGLLAAPAYTKSEPGTELGQLAHLNAHVSADGLCAAVAQGLALAPPAAAAKRAAVRAAYRSEKAAFLHRMQQLRAYLQARADAAAAKRG